MLQRLFFVLLFALTTPFCLDACNYSVKIEGDTAVCGDSPVVNYQAVSSDTTVSYLWEVTGGKILKGVDSSCVTVKWDNTKEKGSITLRATDKDNCTQTADLKITVNLPRKPELILRGCRLYNFVFHARSGPFKYEWRDLVRPQIGVFNTDSFFVLNKVTSNEYHYGVTITDTLTGCSVKDTLTLYVSSKNTEPSGPSSVCIKQVGKYTFPSEGVIDAIDVKGGKVIYQGPGDIHVVWDSVGVSNYINFISKSTCLGEYKIPVKVFDTASPQIVSEQKKACIKDQMVFKVKNRCQSCSYSWIVYGVSLDKVTPQDSQVIVKWGNWGKAYVVVNEYGRIEGCTKSITDTLTIEIDKKPVANFECKTTSCQMDSIQFTNKSTEGAEKYLWIFGDGDFSRQINPRHAFASPGVYNVRLWAYTDQGCTSDNFFSQYVVIRDRSDASWFHKEIKDGEFLFWTNDSTGRMYTWDFGDGSTGFGSRVQHKYKASGDYKIRLVISTIEECGPAMHQENISVTVPTSFIAESDNPLGVKLFPNPFSREFTLSYSIRTPSQVRLRIIDLTGKEILNSSLGFNPAGPYNHNLDLDNKGLQPGMYVIILQAGDMEYKQPLVKMP